MRIVYRISTAFMFLGWLAFCAAIGFAVAVLAGNIAGIIAGALAVFFTLSALYLSNNNVDESLGCMIVGVAVVWFVASICSVAVFLATLMPTGWAIALAILLVLAWLVANYVRSQSMK